MTQTNSPSGRTGDDARGPERIWAFDYDLQDETGEWKTWQTWTENLPFPFQATEYIRADLEATASLSIATQPDPAKVKPLGWESPSAANNWVYQAHAPWGTYGVHICGGKHQAWLEANEKPYERWLGDGYVGSVMEAQSIADADHVERTRRLLQSALEPTQPDPLADPRVLALVDALKQIADEASVPVQTWKNGINFKKMYEGWRKIATTRIDIARTAIAAFGTTGGKVDG